MTRDTLNHEQVTRALHLLQERIVKKLETHGKGTLVNAHETYGKLHEEVQEAAVEMHKNDNERFKDELLDVALVCIWGIASL